MPTKNIYFNKITKIIFALLIVLSVGVSFAFASGARLSFVANAEGGTSGSAHIDATIDNFEEVLETGASITLNETALETASAPNDSIATAQAEQTAVLTLSGDIWKAVESGRLTARLLATGHNTFSVAQGVTRYKKASYKVSGAMSGEGSLGSDNTTFEDKELAPRAVLNAENGNTISITYSASHEAIDTRAGLGSTTAEASVEGYMSFKLELSFENVTVTINSSVGGTVQDINGETLDLAVEAQTLTLGFNDSASFTAVPNDGYYFLGWREEGTTSNILGVTLDLGKAVGIENGVTPSYRALFQQITVRSSESYTYSGVAQGPVVNSTAYTGVYYLTHSYVGTTFGGEEVSISSEGSEPIAAGPTLAGEYTYTCRFFYRTEAESGSDYGKGEEIGGVSHNFTIEKDIPTVTRGTDNATEIEMSYGDNLTSLDMSYSATNSQDAHIRIIGTLALYDGDELVDLNKLLPLTDNVIEYRLKFIPNDSNNYGVYNVPFKVAVKDNIVDEGVNVNGATMTYTISKSIVTDVDGGAPSNAEELKGEVVKVSLRATMNDRSGQYFFIGWRIGLLQDDGSYAYNYITAGQVNRNGSGEVESISGLDYDYYFPYYGDESYTEEQKALYKTARFQAVFVKDTTCGTSADTLEISYSGAVSNRTPSFTPESAGYQFGFGEMRYYHESDPDSGVTTIPVAIGEHTLKYNIINAAMGVVVDTRVIKYNIVVGEVSAVLDTTQSIGYGGYNQATGWARRMYYTLSVPYLIAGGAESYYYSSDNGNTWTQITDYTIANASGCRITFATPVVEGTTSVTDYLFIATHSTHGVPTLYGEAGKEITYNVIAKTSSATKIKIDTVTPTITDVTEISGLSGEWTNDRVSFEAVVSYGGSGAVIDVSYLSATDSSYRTVQSNISYSDGADAEILTGVTVSFDLDTQYSGNVRIRIRSGVGLITEVITLYQVNIDKEAPMFGAEQSENVVNANGWIDKTTAVTYEIIDNGGSGIESVTAIDYEGNPVHVANIGGNRYKITVSDSISYSIIARDNAGNNSSVGVQKNVDIEDIEYEFADGSYSPNAWAADGAEVIFNVTMGASGARILYSVDGGDYMPSGDFSEAQIGAVTTQITLRYLLPVSDSIRNYNFKIENRAGNSVEIPFGVVKFDLDAPVFELITDLGAYQGSNWSSQNLVAEFFAADNQGAINSGFGENSVTVDNGGIINEIGNGRYSLTIDKCTVFTVTIMDIAGNVITREIQANVDTITPEWQEIKAYIGGGNPNDIGEEPTEEDNAEVNTYDFESWITKAYAEPWVRIEFTINLTASGIKLEYSNNNGTTWTALTGTYMPAEGEVTGTIKTRAYITTEQNRSYLFRLTTGSGKYAIYTPESGNTQYVKLDFTAPTLRAEVFRVGDNANFPLKTTWVNKDAQYRIMPSDSALGSGVNYDSIRLMEYPYDASDDDIISGAVTGTAHTMEKSGDYYVYFISAAAKYLLVFSDEAGNGYEGEIFIPHVDKTEGFSLNLKSYACDKDGTGYSTALTKELWLGASDYARFVGTAVFADGGSFGPSGGAMQFSIDGGETWYTSCTVGGEFLTVEEDGNTFTLELNAEQVYSYKFRLITGAGTEYSLAETYFVQKDNTKPMISASATYQTGGAYSGEWTKENLRFALSTSIGTSGGTIYYGVGESVESAEWTALQTLNKNAKAESTYYYVVDYSIEGNYYFKIESGRPNTSSVTETGISVRLDNTEIDFEAVAEIVASQKEVENGSWVNEETSVYPSVKTIGASGISTVYVKVNEGEGYGEYEVLGTAGYKVTLSENTANLIGYIFKIVSVSGMEAESEEFSLGYDDVVPNVEISLGGSKLPEISIYKDWYVSDVDVSVAVTSVVSGYEVYYQYRVNGEEEYSDWLLASVSFALSDPSEKGGSDYYYQFKVVTGSGNEVVSDEKYIPIDTNEYEVSVQLFVGDIASDEEHAYANVSGTGSYARGHQTSVVITPNLTYKIKERATEGYTHTANVDYSVDYDEATSYADTINFVVGGSDIGVRVDFYKDITLEYTGVRQCLQSGNVTDVEFRATEGGFDEFFGAVSRKETGKIVGVKAVYTDVLGEAVALPNAIGTYTLTLTMQEGYEQYHIVNDSCILTVVYFEGDGTLVNPYLINNISDFYYIDEYMHFEDADSESDSRAYLGANRRTATFKQTADIVLPDDFAPIAGVGEGYTNEFKGSYNGFGYEMIYGKTFIVKGDFGLFLNLSGASVLNLGVRLNVRAMEIETGSSVGYVAAHAVNSGIRGVYAIGDIMIMGSEVKVGGIAGTLNASLVSYSFTDVNMTIIKSDGYFGGVVGYMDASYTANVYSVSRVTVTGSERYDEVAVPGTKFAMAGAIAGYAINLDEAGSLPTVSNKSYYLDRNVSFDGSIEQGLSLGNRSTFGQYDKLMHASGDIDFFASRESDGSHAGVKICDITEREYSVTVAELVNVRIDRIKAEANMSGDGTTENPFLVDNLEKLMYIETFPWAVFKQTADIMLEEGLTLSESVPFVGVYDGDNHSITGASVDSDTVRYGGTFGVVGGTIRNLKIIDVYLTYTGEHSVYAGGAVGVLEEDGLLENIIVTGYLEVMTSGELAYAGGIVGVMTGGEIRDTLSLVGVNAEGENLVVGSVVAQAQGYAKIERVVSMSSLTAQYLKKADVGAVAGAVSNQAVSLNNVYYLADSAYANDKNIANPLGYDIGIAIGEVLYKSYSDIIEISINDKFVSDMVRGLYPFEGEGTKESPFIIDSYETLMLMSNYMYAYFELGDDIIIGDVNDDGKLDSKDGYDYDYSPIGNGATFTGSLNGKGYSIIGLTDSLFEVNAGSITDITLSLDYKVYAHEKDIPDSEKVVDSVSGEVYTSAKVAKENEEILFGAACKINRATGSLMRVNVSGEIYIRTRGASKVTLGGLVGVDMGGQVVISQLSASLSVRASQMVVGGIVGEVRYSDRLLDQIGMNDVIVSSGIDLGGRAQIAGTYVGVIGVETAYRPTFASSTEIIFNGVSLGTEQYVGLQK